MTTQTLIRQVRFLDVARAFAILADHADKALDLAVEVDDDEIRVIESNLHNITRKMNGDPIAAQIEALLTHPFHESPTLAPASNGHDKAPEGAAFGWKAIPKPGGGLGDKNGAFECRWQGLTLRVAKIGPANYEGTIDGQHVLQGKFKKNVRERVEKEAAKRANA